MSLKIEAPVPKCGHLRLSCLQHSNHALRAAVSWQHRCWAPTAFGPFNAHNKLEALTDAGQQELFILRQGSFHKVEVPPISRCKKPLRQNPLRSFTWNAETLVLVVTCAGHSALFAPQSENPLNCKKIVNNPFEFGERNMSHRLNSHQSLTRLLQLCKSLFVKVLSCRHKLRDKSPCNPG